MTNNEKIDTEEIISNINVIKEAIQKNSPIIRMILGPSQFKMLGLASSIFIFIICGFSYYFSHIYGSFTQSPTYSKIIIITLTILLMIFGYFLKTRAFNKKFKSMNIEMSLFGIIREYMKIPIGKIQVLVGIIIIPICIFLSISGNSEYILIIIPLTLGFLFAAFWITLNISGYGASTLWMIITPLIGLFFVRFASGIIASHIIWFGLSAGVGMFIVFTEGIISDRKEKLGNIN